MFFYVLSCIILVLLLVGIFLSFKYRNPYKWIHFVGFPGSGKTTLSVKLAQQHIKKGWTVYANFPIPGCYLFDPDDLGKYSQYSNSLIILDEIGLVFDNRNFKAFSNEVRNWAKLHRHFRCKVISFSQSMDYDSKLRAITDKLYLLVNYFGWFSAAKEIRMKWVAVQPDTNSEGRIAQAMVLSPFILAPFGARIYTFIPHWTKYFDSFETMDLPDKVYKKILYPANMPKKFIPKPLRNSDFIAVADPAAAARRAGSHKLFFSKFAAAHKSPSPPDPLKTSGDSASESEDDFEGSSQKNYPEQYEIDITSFL